MRAATLGGLNISATQTWAIWQRVTGEPEFKCCMLMTWWGAGVLADAIRRRCAAAEVQRGSPRPHTHMRPHTYTHAHSKHRQQVREKHCTQQIAGDSWGGEIHGLVRYVESKVQSFHRHKGGCLLTWLDRHGNFCCTPTQLQRRFCSEFWI